MNGVIGGFIDNIRKCWRRRGGVVAILIVILLLPRIGVRAYNEIILMNYGVGDGVAVLMIQVEPTETSLEVATLEVDHDGNITFSFMGKKNTRHINLWRDAIDYEKEVTRAKMLLYKQLWDVYGSSVDVGEIRFTDPTTDPPEAPIEDPTTDIPKDLITDPINIPLPDTPKDFTNPTDSYSSHDDLVTERTVTA